MRALLFICLALISCSDNEVNKQLTSAELEKQQFELITIGRSLVSVSLNGLNKTSDYNNFTLSFSGTPGNNSFAYSTSSRPAVSVWQSSGTWIFNDNAETGIIRDPGTVDELNMIYSIKNGVLTISFNFSGNAFPGRIKGEQDGEWVFVLK